MIYCGAKDTKESPGALKISGVESLCRMGQRDVKLTHGKPSAKWRAESSNLSAAQLNAGGIADDLRWWDSAKWLLVRVEISKQDHGPSKENQKSLMTISFPGRKNGYRSIFRGPAM